MIFGCCLLTFFKINFFKKKFRITVGVSNNLDRTSVLIRVQTVCKGNQQMKKKLPLTKKESKDRIYSQRDINYFLIFSLRGALYD